MHLSVVIPAYNEEACLDRTLTSIKTAARGYDIAMIVVDNASTDRTATIALSAGARVVFESQRSVARARNAGAAAATSEILVFVDADTLVPDGMLLRIREVMSDPACFGGAVDTNYTPRRRLVSVYLQFWRVIGTIAGMAQGAAQFYRREVFQSLGGYDQSLWMGEDVDFY